MQTLRSLAAGATLALLISQAVLPASAQTPAAQARSAAVSAVKVPDLTRAVLPNGITVIVMPQREVPLIAFNAVLRGGAAVDPVGKSGLAALVADLLDKGAGSRDAFAFADAVAGVGGSFGGGAGNESISLGGQFLATDRALMIELLADALQRPRFDPGEFQKLRQRDVEFIKAAKDSDPNQLLSIYGRAALFGSHPYARPVEGSERSLRLIELSDVQSYYRSHFGADRLTLVFTGDIDASVLMSEVERAFASWGKATTALPALASPAPIRGRRVLLVDSPGSVQTYFWIGSVGVARKFPGRAALDVVNTLYGGRFTSILNTELRIKSGLSYGASSSFTRGTVPGPFAIASFAQTENTEKAIDIALASLATLKRAPPGAAMLESARSYVLGQYPTRLETAAQWAGTLADLELYGLDKNYIEGYGPALAAVTAPDAKSVIGKAFPNASDVVIVMIGDAARIRSTVRKYGPLTELALSDPDYAPAPPRAAARKRH